MTRRRDPPSLLLVASDPAVIAAARDAARRMREARPLQIVSGAEALSRLVGPGQPPRHLLLQGDSAGDALLSVARDPFSRTDVLVVARPGETVPDGLRSAPPLGAALAEALENLAAPGALPASDAPELAAGLGRGEITVRFQPIVRISDRRPVMVEALARWERPGLALGAGAFVALAEQAGLASALTRAVARRAAKELRALAAVPRMALTFNVPLGVLLEPGLGADLRAVAAEAGLSPRDIRLELTESMAVRDTALLRRALLRLRDAGFAVLLDDLGIADHRRRLLDLPFAGVKLDRSLVTALATRRSARAEVERLVREAHRHGRAVIAEGVTGPELWRAAAAAGCDLAQGFGVGRPLPAAALPGWMGVWRAAGKAVPAG
jgi:EAL domain-containing protein (putative c-di-GMP-specific phosphodiesterase class I)